MIILEVRASGDVVVADGLDVVLSDGPFAGLSLREAIKADVDDVLGWHKYGTILRALRLVDEADLPAPKVPPIPFDPKVHRVVASLSELLVEVVEPGP